LDASVQTQPKLMHVCVIFLAPHDPRPHMCSVYVLHASVASIG